MKLEAHYYESFDSFLQNNDDPYKEHFLLVAQDCEINEEALQHTLAKITGAFFPEIIFSNKLYKTGLIAVEIGLDMELFFACNIQDVDFVSMDLKNTPTILTVVDGLSKHNEEYLSTLFKYSGVNTNIFGGGAGSLQLGNEKVFFTNEGFFKECAVIITMQQQIDLSVQHGWQYLDGPFVVTSSKGNEVEQIDYKSAFEVYKDVIFKDSGIELTQENFLEVSKNYPLGVVKYQGEQLVRDTIGFKEGMIQLVGNMSQNSIINILKGNKQSLLDATKKASETFVNKECNSIVMFDCLTRKTFLEDKFEDELDIIFTQNSTPNVIGAISIGEVANDGKDFIKFFNKTCVIGGICN